MFNYWLTVSEESCRGYCAVLSPEWSWSHVTHLHRLYMVSSPGSRVDIPSLIAQNDSSPRHSSVLSTLLNLVFLPFFFLICFFFLSFCSVSFFLLTQSSSRAALTDAPSFKGWSRVRQVWVSVPTRTLGLFSRCPLSCDRQVYKNKTMRPHASTVD